MKDFPKPFRLFRNGFFYLVLATGLCSPLAGQFKFRELPNRQDPQALSESVGQDFWDWFLLNRSAGVFEIAGILTNRPAGAASETYNFLMQGNWQSDVQETSLTLTDESGNSFSKQVVNQHGHTHVTGANGEIILKEQDWSQPVIEDFPITWMDLLMPYFDWEEVTYLGPDRYLGRPAHRFSLVNPDPDVFPARVTVTLDGDYAAILKADLFDKHGSLIKRMRIGGIKKFDDGWMFNELIWENREARSSIRMNVYSYRSSPR